MDCGELRFWDSRIDITRSNARTAVHAQLVECDRIESLHLKWKSVEPKQPHYIWESDVAKVGRGYGMALIRRRIPMNDASSLWLVLVKLSSLLKVHSSPTDTSMCTIRWWSRLRDGQM